MRTCALDIETTGTEGDIRIVTVIALVDLDERKSETFVAERPEAEDEVLEVFAEAIKGFDRIVVWKNFDIPFLKARYLFKGMKCPFNKYIEIVDVSKVLEELPISQRRLKDIASLFGIERKDWMNGRDMPRLYDEHLKGNPKALDTITKHCEEDVRTLVEIYKKLVNVGIIEDEKLLR